MKILYRGKFLACEENSLMIPKYISGEDNAFLQDMISNILSIKGVRLLFKNNDNIKSKQTNIQHNTVFTTTISFYS